MENTQKSSVKSKETPKRNKPSDDEFSPETLQKNVNKKMDVTSDELKEILAGIRMINNMEQNLASVMQQMPFIAKSEELELLRRDIAEIKTSHELFKEKIESIDKRVSDLENDFDALKNGDVESMANEVEDIRACTQQLSQSNLNNFLIIRHFPLEIKNDRKELLSTINKIFTALQLDIHDNEFDATAMKVRNKDLAFIQLKFSSQLLKSKVLSKFRQLKKISENEPLFIVEKLTGLTIDHVLNGTTITMHNRLTKHNIEILQAARNHVPKYFDFVFDDAEGRILAKCGNSFNTIHSIENIRTLVDKLESSSRPNQQRQPSRPQPAPASGIRRGRSGGLVKGTIGRGG